MLTASHKTLRRFARTLRHAPDRLLHRVRHREAVRYFRERGLPRSVLFVCHGNVCRSPYAEVAYLDLFPEQIHGRVAVASAGFIGPGRQSPSEAIRTAARRGHDLEPHRSALLTPQAVASAETVFVMDARQQRAVCERFGRSSRSVPILGDLDPEPIETRAIRDPWGQPEDVFEASYARIDRCLEALVEAAGSWPPGGPDSAAD